MTTPHDDDWIAAFQASSLNASQSPAASSGFTVVSSISSPPTIASSKVDQGGPSVSLAVGTGESGGVAKRAHLFCFDPASPLCLGFVGEGGKRFCIKLITSGGDSESGGTCGVNKHVHKFQPDPDLLYLRGNDSTAYCQPAFPRAVLPPEVLSNINAVKKTNQEWKELFAYYEDPNDIVQPASSGVPRLTLKTPKKSAPQLTDGGSTPVLVPAPLKDILMQADILPSQYWWWNADDETSLLPGPLLQFLRDLQNFLTLYDQWLVEPHAVTHDRLSTVEEDLHQLKAVCDIISGNVGRPVSLQGMDFPDLWCAIEFIGSSMPGIHTSAEMIGIKSKLNQLEELVNRVQPVLAKQIQENSAALPGVIKSVESVEQLLSRHEARFTLIQPILLNVQTLMKDVADLSNKLSQLSSSSAPQPTPVDSDPWQRTIPVITPRASAAPMPDQFLASSQGDMEARVKTLEHAFRSLEKRTVGEGTKIGRFLFQSQEDLRIWMTTHVPNNRFGLFLDAVSIFDFLAQPHLDAQENMSQLYNSQKNGFDTTYESRIVSSMQNLFPNLFGKSSADGMDTAKALPGLQTVEKWNNNGVTGLFLQVERELPNVDLQFRNAIASTFEDYADARDLALELLYRSKKFALDLCNFIQRDFDFWRHKGYSKTEAWQLTCLSVRRIFEDIHVIRVVGRDCRDIKNPQATATQIVWATIRAHTVMDEYMRRNFFEHPSISAVIAHHLASHHTRPDAGLEVRIAALESSVENLSSRLDSIQSRLFVVETKNGVAPKKPRGGKNKGGNGPKDNTAEQDEA